MTCARYSRNFVVTIIPYSLPDRVWLILSISDKGAFINDVMVVGERGQGFCDNSTKVSVIKKRDDGGREVQECPKLRDVIYERPLKESYKRNEMLEKITKAFRIWFDRNTWSS